MNKVLNDDRLQVPVPGGLRDKLEAVAERRGVKLMELIRAILRGYLDDEDRLLAEQSHFNQRGRGAADQGGDR